MPTISSEDWAYIREQKAAGNSHMAIARNFGPQVTVAVLDAEFGREPHPEFCGHSRGFYRWLMDDCEYTWRPDNRTPPDAPWGRA